VKVNQLWSPVALPPGVDGAADPPPPPPPQAASSSALANKAAQDFKILIIFVVQK